MERRQFLAASVAASAFGIAGKVHAEAAGMALSREFYQIRRYGLLSGPQTKLTESYFSDALIPALGRTGMGPVGAFRVEIGPETPVYYALIPGATAPKIVTKAMVSQMKKGAVIVDVAIDQGGCVETARPTSHSNPSYKVDGVVHYCVTNMPGAVPHTSTLALTNSTFPYLLRIANLGAREALKQDAGLAEGLNTWEGVLTHRGVAESQQREWTATASVIA